MRLHLFFLNFLYLLIAVDVKADLLQERALNQGDIPTGEVFHSGEWSKINLHILCQFGCVGE